MFISRKTKQNNEIFFYQLAGTRYAAENLYKVCSNYALIPDDVHDSCIEKLLPAQQRTIRTFIPKLSAHEKDCVDSFKRPQSSFPANRETSKRSQGDSKTIRPASASARLRKKAPVAINMKAMNDENNPLATAKTDPHLKQKRIGSLGKSDSWPDFPDDPSKNAQDSLRKTWAALIPSYTVQTLLPTNGATSMELFISGCDLLSKSINHSRSISDSSGIIEQLDLILKWAVIALAARDHTVALRTLLSVILALFERLHEATYVMTNKEASIILPYLLDRAGVAKAPLQDQFLKVLSFISSTDVFPIKHYGSEVCVKVLAKSLRSKSRLLAANQLQSCVENANLPAIGRSGLRFLGAALSTEKLVENITAYISLCDAVLVKLNGDFDKFFDFCGQSLTESARSLIHERCSKRLPNEINQDNIPNLSSRLRTPSRSSNIPFSLTDSSPRIEASRVNVTSSKEDAPKLSSSAAAKASLKNRLQILNQGNNTLPLPRSSSSQMQTHVPEIEVDQSALGKSLREIELIVDNQSPFEENAVVTKIDEIYQLVSANIITINSKDYDNCARCLARYVPNPSVVSSV